MTIVAGFRCQDGMVLCADTEMTGIVQKWANIKLGNMLWTSEIGLAMAFAGAAAYAKMACEKILQRALDTKPEHDSIFSVIEETVLEIYRGPIAAHPGPDKPTFSLLIAVRIADESPVALIKTTDTAVHAGEPFEAIGVGAELAGYVWRNLRRTDFSLEEGALAATYILREVKENVLYCGKSSLIISVGLKAIRVVPDETVARLERWLERTRSLSIDLPRKPPPYCRPILETLVGL